MFLSTTLRNHSKKSRDPSPPPGIYNNDFNTISESVRKKVESGLGNPLLASLKAKMKLVAPFNSWTDRFRNKEIKDHEKFLGPGYYEFKTFVETTKPRSINSKFLSNEDRFAKGFDGKKPNGDDPGPGKYEKERDDPWIKKTYNITFAD